MTTGHRHHRTRCPSAACHPGPSTALCASCLRERLAGIDGQSFYSSSSSAAAAKLSRTRSCSSSARPPSLDQPRRRSCDARPQSSSLHDLFATEDEGSLENPARSSWVSTLHPTLMEEEEEEVEESESEGVESSSKSRRRGFVVDDSFEGGGEMKMMKEFIDLELTLSRNKNGGRDLGEMASGFTRKLRKLRLRNRYKSKGEDANADFRRSRSGARSQIIELGLGRRSCDIGPRLSLDTARMSFDEPRASWDGCLITNGNPLPRSMAPLVEEVQSPSKNGFSCVDEARNPGGSAQTLDCSSMQMRKGFERSTSVKGSSLEVHDPKVVSNPQVSPGSFDLSEGKKLMVTEKELRDSNWYSLRNHRKESLEAGPNGGRVASHNMTEKGLGFKKKSGRFNVWNIWGLIQRKGNNKREGGEQKSLKHDGNAIEISAIQTITGNERGVSQARYQNLESNVTEASVIQRKIKSSNTFIPEKSLKLEGNIAEGSSTHRRNGSKKSTGLKQEKNLSLEGNIIKGSLAESLLKLRRASNGNAREYIGEKKLLCNYGTKPRNSCDGSINGIYSERNSRDSLFQAANSFRGGRKSCDGSFLGMTSDVQAKGDMLLQRNKSTRNPPNNLEEKIVLPFYLTPLRSFKGSRSGRRSGLENPDLLVEMS